MMARKFPIKPPRSAGRNPVAEILLALVEIAMEPNNIDNAPPIDWEAIEATHGPLGPIHTASFLRAVGREQ